MNVLLPGARCGLLALILSPWSSAGPGPISEQAETPAESFELTWAGRLSTVHRDGDASPHVRLADVANTPDALAIGPLAGLRGEITVLDGIPFIARAENDSIRISHDRDVEAPFLVYGVVPNWEPVPIDETLPSIATLERWLASVAERKGLADRAFPFKITTSHSEIDYHVITNREVGYQVSRPHHELMRHFESRSQPVTLVGVFSTSHAGIFTHQGQWTHIHVVSRDRKASGHVDALELGSDAVLYLPQKE